MNPMTYTAHRPVQPATPVLCIQNLNLAPEGWRPCVEKIAEGFAEVIGAHSYCMNCGGVIEGKQGHRFDCVTMLARRMLANEPLLHAQLRATGADVYIGLETAFPDAGTAFTYIPTPHSRRPALTTCAPTPVHTSDHQPPLHIPRFLAHD